MNLPATTAVLAVVSLVTAGCDILGTSAVRVRLANDSELAFDRVVLYPGGVDSLVATNLVPLGVTDYQQVDQAFEFATIRILLGTETAGLQVIDHVGDQPLRGGDYTYLIKVTKTANQTLVTLTLRRE